MGRDWAKEGNFQLLAEVAQSPASTKGSGCRMRTAGALPLPEYSTLAGSWADRGPGSLHLTEMGEDGGHRS